MQQNKTSTKIVMRVFITLKCHCHGNYLNLNKLNVAGNIKKSLVCNTKRIQKGHNKIQKLQDNDQCRMFQKVWKFNPWHTVGYHNSRLHNQVLKVWILTIIPRKSSRIYTMVSWAVRIRELVSEFFMALSML